MSAFQRPAVAAALALFLASHRVSAVSIPFDNFVSEIRDGSAVPWQNTQTIDTSIKSIGHLAVTLNFAGPGGFNGDLFVALSNDQGGYAVLLNRVGTTASNDLGYSDNGMNVTLDDSAPNDIHTYRRTFTGSDIIPLGGSLGGTWAPDGRTTDPDSVVDTDKRTALLGAFNGENPNGKWTLIVADLDTGGVNHLRSWGLTIDPAAAPPVSVPEHVVTAFGFACSVSILALLRNTRVCRYAKARVSRVWRALFQLSNP
jgi:hypothetical protein